MNKIIQFFQRENLTDHKGSALCDKDFKTTVAVLPLAL